MSGATTAMFLTKNNITTACTARIPLGVGLSLSEVCLFFRVPVSVLRNAIVCMTVGDLLGSPFRLSLLTALLTPLLLYPAHLSIIYHSLCDAGYPRTAMRCTSTLFGTRLYSSI